MRWDHFTCLADRWEGSSRHVTSVHDEVSEKTAYFLSFPLSLSLLFFVLFIFLLASCLSVCRLWHSPFILKMTIRLIMILNFSFFPFSISILQRLLKPSERNVVLLSFCSFHWRETWAGPATRCKKHLYVHVSQKKKNVLCAATASCKTAHRDLRTTVMYRVVLREDCNLPSHWNWVHLVGVLHLWSCPLTTSAASDVRVQCMCTMQASTHLRTHDVQGVHQKVSSAAPHPSKFGTTLN